MDITIKMLEAISSLFEREKQLEDKKRAEGDLFNVFNTIGLRTEEVRLHSAFIAELLNPQGSHGLAYRFLQAFMEIIGLPDGWLDYRLCPHGKVNERVIGPVTETEGGRLDIIVEDGNHAIIIENKIYAGDRDNQLLRYNNYGKKKFPNGYKLVYLTLDRREPETRSLGNVSIKYHPISYGKEIVEWLEKCYAISEGKPLVQSVIKQYCELVKQITNTDMDTNYKNNLMQIMLNPKNAIAIGELFQLQDDWWDVLCDKYIWKPLEEFASERDMLFGKDCEDGYESGAWIYRKEWKYYGIFVWTRSKKYWSDLFVGISWYNYPNRNNKIYKKDYHQLNCLTSELPDEEWPYGKEYLRNDIRDWAIDITEKIVNGEVINYIKQKFEEIIIELDEGIEKKQLRMP